MTQEKPSRSQPPAELRRVLPLLAVLFALLAAWLAWGGVQQWRDARLSADVESARDAVLAAAEGTLSAQTRELASRLASAPVQTALRTGDDAAAEAAIGKGWKDAAPVQLVAPDLEAAYAAPAEFGFSKLALLEAALNGNKPVARVVREGKQGRLGLAAPVSGKVAYVSLPLAVLTDGFDAAQVPARGYVGLRQGGHTVRESSNQALAGGAEALARPVGKTGLRVVAATPDGTEAPMGLGPIGALLAAIFFGGLAALALLMLLGKLNLKRRRGLGSSADDNEPTLVQTLRQEAVPAAAVRSASADETPAQPVAAAKALEVDPGIFRAYDIRGVVGETLSVEVAESIGQAIGSVMEEQGLVDIVVGRDGRLSGPELSAGLIAGLRKSGRNVIDIGLAPTPVAYFAAYHLRTGSSVAVTGSHNPPDYNGFKIVIGGQTLSGDAITDLYSRIHERRLHAAAQGSLQERDIGADYVQRIADDVQLDRPLKVVVDAGNGVAGGIAPQLLEAIGAEVIPLFCDVDGTFPNHHPDPSEPHNLEDLIATVKRFDADLGLAFDGDADRLGVVTKEGAVIFPDRLLMLFAADVLERNPGALVIYDVKCTGKLQGWVLRHGGTPLMWQTGHSLIKAKMRETGAELAGEMSGHFFFQERWYGFDDGMYSAARLLEILAARPESPSEVLDALPNAISTPEIKVPVEAGNAHEIVSRFVAGAQFEGARLTTIDGLRADWEDGWGLLRASNTTPILVLRFEADSEEVLARIKDDFRARLAQVAPEIEATF